MNKISKIIISMIISIFIVLLVVEIPYYRITTGTVNSISDISSYRSGKRLRMKKLSITFTNKKGEIINNSLKVKNYHISNKKMLISYNIRNSEVYSIWRVPELIFAIFICLISLYLMWGIERNKNNCIYKKNELSNG